MNNLKNKVIWNNVKGTQEEIKGYVNNYCNDFNVYATNLVINNETVTFTTYSKISYEDLVVRYIREKYSLNEELALHRKYFNNPNSLEFEDYDNYVEYCKERAKTFINEREIALK